MKPPDSIFCPLRKIWVANLPEEKVRQNLIKKLVNELSYPLGQIAIEISLSQLPYLLSNRFVPKRRADLIIFGSNLHPEYPLFPLLLIECKSTDINSKVFRQVVGYNQYVGASYIGVANPTSTIIGCFNSPFNDFSFFSEIPSYENLLKLARQKTFFH